MEFLAQYAAYLAALAGILLGILFVWLLMRTQLNTERARADERQRSALKDVTALEDKVARQESEIRQLHHTELTLLKSQSEFETRLDAQQKSNAEKQAILEAAEIRLGQTFESLSHDALRSSQEQFLNLACTVLRAQQEEAKVDIEQRRQALEGMVKSVADSLEKVQHRIGDLEEAREGAYAALHEQVRQISEVGRELYSRVATLTDHFAKMDRSLPTSTDDDFAGFAEEEEEEQSPAAIGAIAALRSASAALKNPPVAPTQAEDFEGFDAPEDHNPIIEEDDSEEPDPISAANDLRDALKNSRAS